MKKQIKISWLWVKTNWKYLLSALGILITIISIAYLRNNYSKYSITKKKLELDKAKQEAAKLEGKKEILAQNREKNEEKIKQVEVRIETVTKKIVKRRAEVKAMSLKEQVNAYDDLGY